MFNSVTEIKEFSKSILSTIDNVAEKFASADLSILLDEVDGEFVLSDYGIYKITEYALDFYRDEIKRLSFETKDYSFVCFTNTDIDFETFEKEMEIWNEENRDRIDELSRLLAEFRETHGYMFSYQPTLPGIHNFSALTSLIELSPCDSLKEAVSRYKGMKKISYFPLDLDRYRTRLTARVLPEYEEEYTKFSNKTKEELGITPKPVKIHTGNFHKKYHCIKTTSTTYKSIAPNYNAIKDPILLVIYGALEQV